MNKKARPFPHEVLYTSNEQRRFGGANLLQIAMPLGGIGAGGVCLNGYGGLQDFSLYHKPHLSALPGSHPHPLAAFGLLHVKGEEPVTRMVEGRMPPEKIYDQGLQGAGFRNNGHEGLPRFAQSTFQGEYPFGTVSLSDPDVPLLATITGWSPFIPLDDKNSSIPCAILEYSFTNRTRKPVTFEFSYHLAHPAVGAGSWIKTQNALIPNAGVHFTNEEAPDDPSFGSGALCAARGKPKIKTRWLRAGWFDAVTALWREASEGALKPNKGNSENYEAINGGSLLFADSVAPGKSVTFPVIISWHFPNCDLVVGRADVPDNIRGAAAASACCPAAESSTENTLTWRPYYAGQWSDARDVALYVRRHYESLRQRTLAFKNALFGSTLPSYVLDAVSANLGILKSPTVLRQENGNIWGWEGCNTQTGCCAGTCTHVWNYAQAMPHLFPQLERTLREQEYLRSIDERGHVAFRAALPDGPAKHDFYAAADGQPGGIMKLFRDWHISGDDAWMSTLYALAKRSMEYCIRTWDPDEKGALFEPHHNTYDIEFWGPDGMCTSVYVGALAAMREMAHALGFDDDAEYFGALAQKGARFLDEELFNGEYFEQKVLWKKLQDQSFASLIDKNNLSAGDDEMIRLLRKEGPKYQYGNGCLSDGVIGAWMAQIYGIDSPQTKAHIKKHLKSIFQYNFRTDLSTHANPQRPGYAMGEEAGLLLCSWPRGGKPTLPFVYSDEVWTGIEYQVASHLIEEGLLDEGLTIVKAVRDRHEGRTRNPWNEYECGNYYARAMASYALLNSLSGFRYSAVTKTLWLAPKINADDFTTFFCTASGFGTVRLNRSTLTVEMIEGALTVEKIVLSADNTTRQPQQKAHIQAGQNFTWRLS